MQIQKSSLVLFSVLFLTACGSSGGSSNNPSTQTNGSTTTDSGDGSSGTGTTTDTSSDKLEMVTICDESGAFAQTFLKLVNETRTKGQTCGSTHMPSVSTVTWNAKLCQAALAHSKDMAIQNYFDHQSLDGRSPGDRIKAAGYQWNTYGENIYASHNADPAAIHAGWVKSSGHCKNIMNPSVDEIGVAMVKSKAGVSKYPQYWTEVFATQGP